MYISIDWLKSFMPLESIVEYENLKKKSLLFNYSDFPVNNLTLSGFELEEININNKKSSSNIFFEIDTTPNRSDITNIFGFTHETLNLMNLKIKTHNFYKKNQEIPNSFKFTNLKTFNIDDVYSAYFCKISNPIIKKSPVWLKKRLVNCNITPFNNINDLTNYSILEFGQPIQFYDLNKIKKIVNNKELKINIRKAVKGEKFIGSNDILYKLSENQIVITVNDYIISLGGIMAQKDVIVDENSTDILLECLNLNEKNIKLTLKELGLKTQSAILFEKNISLSSTNFAFQRILKILELTNRSRIKISNILIGANKITNKKIYEINFCNTKKLIGNTKIKNSITTLEILSCLKKLNFEIVKIKNEKCTIKIPESRNIKNEMEINEEISRIYGFQNIKSTLPRSIKVGKITKEQKLISVVKKNLINKGFNELITYSLGSENLKENIILFNPLSQEYSNLRISLLNNLIKTITENRNQRNKYFSCFEIGRVFNKKLEQEYTFLGGLFGGEEYKTNWSKQFEILNWYEAKEVINQLFKIFRIEIEFNKLNKNIRNIEHPGRTAILTYKLNEIGLFTQIHPLYAKQNNISPSLFLFEINLTRISQLQVENEKKYEIFSIYPKIIKDISLEIPKTISANQMIYVIKQIIKNLKINDIQTNFEIFDNFENLKQLEKRILGFKVEYKSLKKTLITDEIEEINKKIIGEITNYIEKNEK